MCYIKFNFEFIWVEIMSVKIAVVGGGPAGRTSAMCLAKNGFDVDLFERDKIGGTCLNYGCTYITGLREMADIVNNLSILNRQHFFYLALQLAVCHFYNLFDRLYLSFFLQQLLSLCH